MTRTEAYQILTKYLKNQNLIKHSLAAEAAMIGLYKRLVPEKQQNKDTEEKWGITGLLHDADYELSKGQPEKHGLLLFEKEKNTIPDDIAHAIKSHNFDFTNVIPKSNMDWAIASCDQLTGLIVAAALIHPEKKLSAITPDFVMNRLYEKSFAKGASRESIRLCETKLGLTEKEFITIVLQSMQSISNDLGL